jgi:hypothetical protein
MSLAHDFFQGFPPSWAHAVNMPKFVDPAQFVLFPPVPAACGASLSVLSARLYFAVVQVEAMTAAAAPATRTSVRARAQRKVASYAKLQAVVRKQMQDYERSAAVAARRDRQYQTSTASCMHLLIACYDRLTLHQEKKFSRRVLVRAARGLADGLGGLCWSMQAGSMATSCYMQI